MSIQTNTHPLQHLLNKRVNVKVNRQGLMLTGKLTALKSFNEGFGHWRATVELPAPNKPKDFDASKISKA